MNFDKFLERKLAKEESLNETKTIEVKGLGELIFKKLSDMKYINILDSCAEDGSKQRQYIYNVNVKLIYNCCDELKNTDLHRELEVKVPYDIVSEILTIDEITRIGLKLQMWHEKGLNISEKIKN